MTLRQAALDYLERDGVLCVAMLEALRTGRASPLSVTPQGVALQMGSRLLLSADDAPAALSLVPAHWDGVVQVAGVQRARQVAQALGLSILWECYQSVYCSKTPRPVCADIRPLGLEYHQAILDHYHLFHDPEYITQRIEAGVMYGIFVEDNLAGFVGEHWEGSMGMLEVFPPYRRLGLATQLHNFTINRYLAQGRTPFAEVLTDNAPSLALQAKMGMTVSQDTVCALGRQDSSSH